MRGPQGRENKMTEIQHKHNKIACPCSGAKTKFINPDKCIFRRVFDNEMQQKFFCTHCAPSIIYDYPATVRFGDVPEKINDESCRCFGSASNRCWMAYNEFVKNYNSKQK